MPAGRWDLEQIRRAVSGSFDTESAVLGVHTQPLTESLAKSLGVPAREGALVSSVVASSPADRAGLRSSDVIVNLNGEPVRSKRHLREQLRRVAAHSSVQLQLVRDGKQEELVVTLQRGVGSPGGTDESLRWLIGIPTAESWRSRVEVLEGRIKSLEARLQELQKRLDDKTPITTSEK